MADQRTESTKRRKTTPETTEEQTTAIADRISDLPEEILIKILTAADLETRTVIQTSVFSRSWRNLWKSALATKLSFEFPDGRRISEARRKRFVAFVDGVLSFRDREYSHSNDGIDVLSVTINNFPMPILSSLLSRIFIHGMVHRARTLRLVALYPIDRLPPDLTEMWRPVQNLEISYWDDCRQVLREPWGKFSALKTLRLYQCVLEHPGYNTFGPMTSLTDLEVVECKLSNSFMICGDNLVRIVLVYSKDLWSHESRIKICAPNLKSFTCKGLNPARFASCSEFSSLECLDIDVQLEEEEEKKKRKASLDCFRMFRNFGRAKRVTLHPNVITTLTRFPDILEKRRSSFRRMQCLEFHGDCKSVLPSLKVFNSLVNYFFDKVIPETALLDCIFSRDSRPVVVRWNDLIA